MEDDIDPGFLADESGGTLPDNSGVGQPSFMAELGLIGMEAVNDIRGSFNEVFFGSDGGASETGTFMNPTMMDRNDALHADGGSVYGEGMAAGDAPPVEPPDAQMEAQPDELEP